MRSIAATMRPLRLSIASAIATMRRFGVAVCEARRMASATSLSDRDGVSAQAMMKAAAVERLTPA